MATLTVTATHNYSSETLTNIDSIVFATPGGPGGGATATFRSDQFGPGLIANNVAITGDPHQNIIQVNAPGVFSAAQWTFSNWGSSDRSGFDDGIVLSGSPEAGNDTITGSSQNDQIRASSQEFDNDEGADILSGGDGDDVLQLHRGSSYALLDGGTGTDTIWVESVMVDPGHVDLTNTTIVSVERLRLAASLAHAILNGDQIGGPGKIQTVEGYNEGSSTGLTVNGSHVDLSTVTFLNFVQTIQLNGTSALGNTLIGSSQADLINAFGGSSGDVLDGRGGADTLTGGSGDDRYVYATGYGADKVAGFVAGAGTPDKIDLTGIPTVHNLSDALDAATQSGSDTVFNFGSGDTLTLQNIQKTALAADDFIFNQLLHPSAHDFNGDLKSDIFLQNSNGSTYLWQMNGLGVKADSAGPLVDASWHVMSTKSDFDGDGKSDVVLQNTSGATFFWEMSGPDAKAYGDGPTIDPSWHIAGTGDLDGDGKGDVVLQNDSGATYFWLMNGLSVKAFGDGPKVDPSWHIVGTADIDGDGKSDIVLQNTNGSTYFWEMNGLSVKADHAGTTVDPSWHIVGTGDLGRDGKDDIILQNTNGSTYFWEMDGFDTKADGSGPTVDPSWHIAEIGDINADGKSDIVLQNTNGSTYFWEMNGFNVMADANGPTIDPGWHII